MDTEICPLGSMQELDNNDLDTEICNLYPICCFLYLSIVEMFSLVQSTF